MKKNIQYQFGASLFALAFSLGVSLPAAAQTCVPPPSCDTLGFTKTAADCEGKTILKCPFDTSKVYCPGVEEQTKSYALGDTYYADGVAVGKVIKLDCATGDTCSHGIVSTVGTRSGTYEEASQGCASMTAGSLTWYMPDINAVIAIAKYIGGFSMIWSNSGNCINASGNEYEFGCAYRDGTSPGCFGHQSIPYPCNAETTSNFRQGYYCVAAF